MLLHMAQQHLILPKTTLSSRRLAEGAAGLSSPQPTMLTRHQNETMGFAVVGALNPYPLLHSLAVSSRTTCGLPSKSGITIYSVKCLTRGKHSNGTSTPGLN